MSGVDSNELLVLLAQHVGARVTRRVERPSVTDWRLEHILEKSEQDFQSGAFFVVGEQAARATSKIEDGCDVLPWTTLTLDGRFIIEKSELIRGSTRQGAAVSDKIEIYRARRVEKLDKRMTFGVVNMGRFHERWVVHLDALIALDKPDRMIFRLVGRHADYGRYQRIEQMFGSKGIVAAPEKNPIPEEMPPDRRECQLEGMIQLWPSAYYICMASQKESAAVPQQPYGRSMQQSCRGHPTDVWSQRSSALNVQARGPAVTSDAYAFPSHIGEPGTPGTPPNMGKGALTSQRSSDMGTSPANEGLPVLEDTEANKSATSDDSDELWTCMLGFVGQPGKPMHECTVPKTFSREDIPRLLESVDIHDILRALSSKFDRHVIEKAFMDVEPRKGQSSEDPRRESMSRIYSLEKTAVSQEASLTASESANVTAFLSSVSKEEGSENLQRKDSMFGLPRVLPVKVIPRSRGQKDEKEVPGTSSVPRSRGQKDEKEVPGTPSVPRSRGQKEDMEVSGTFSIKTLCQMVNDAIGNGERPRLIALAHEKTEGGLIEQAFSGYSVPAKHFTKGRLKESNYITETRNYNVLVLNPHMVLNTGPRFLSTITAVCEPVDITSSRELDKLRQQCQELNRGQQRNIKWYKMEKET